MKSNYKLSHRLLACILFVNLFLQSCSNTFNQLTPQEKEQSSRTLKLSDNSLVNTYKEIVTSGGYLASFYEDDGELKANLRADEKQREPNYQGIPVVVEEGTDLASLTKLDPITQRNRIPLSRKNGKIDRVVILNGEVAGGMKKGHNSSSSTLLSTSHSSSNNDEDNGSSEDRKVDFETIVLEKEEKGLASTGEEVVKEKEVTTKKKKKREKRNKDKEKEKEKEKNRNVGINKKLEKKIGSDLNALAADMNALSIEEEIEDDKQEDASAQNHLANKYYYGEEIDKDYEKAVELYRKAAEQDFEDAQFNLGWMYENGKGVTQNYRKAVRWYQKAADQGHTIAQYNLGCMYEKGQGTAQSDQEAIKWYKQADKQGYARAQYNLGEIYYYSESLEKDYKYKKAVKWYKKAAKRGKANAQYSLGWMYDSGQGINQSDKKAARWYQKAADRGYARAQYTLGIMYEEGRGVEQDNRQAAKWFQKSAQQGYAKAQSKIQRKLEKLNEQLKSGKEEINFTDYSEFYIPFYRGIHYLPELFPNKKHRDAIRQAKQKDLPLYSASACSASKLGFLAPGFDDHESIKNNAEIIKAALDSLKSFFPESYHKFHEVYSNSHQEFHNRLHDPFLKTNVADSTQRSQAFFNYLNFLKQQKKDTRDFEIEAAILRNPHVSFCLIPRHAVKYALGDKSFYNPEGELSPLLSPDYDAYGNPTNPDLGKVYVALLPIQDFCVIDPYIVARNHALGNVRIATHHQNNILKENEVTVSGYLPGKLVIETRNICCPNFNADSCPGDYKSKYGMDEDKV